jgi:hypothetical protein
MQMDQRQGEAASGAATASKHLRIVLSKAEPAANYVEIARGTWVLGCEPRLQGDPIPPEVLTGLEVQARDTKQTMGTIVYDRADVRYAMDFEVLSGK